MNLAIETIEGEFSVCKLPDFSEVDMTQEFTFTGRTREECSLVCFTDQVPQNALCREDGWRAFRVQGVLDFSLIGILAEISACLAEAGIGIFVVSTYNTDYILVKKENYQKALEALKKNDTL